MFQHDHRYKQFFANTTNVENLLKCFVHKEFVNKLKFNTLERLDKSFINKRFEKREADYIYKVKFNGEDFYMFILLEFSEAGCQDFCVCFSP